MSGPPQQASLVVIIFAATYAGLALGKIPGLLIDRAGIAVVGAAALLACGAMTMSEAAQAVDYETIVLLFGMMVVVAYLELAGFFAWTAKFMAERFQNPYALLAAVIATSGTLSAFLVNDVVCVALTPLVLRLCRKSGKPPIPYLIGLATASNIGSVATITGNPQNIIVGSLSHISYARFAARLAPIAIVGLVLDFAVTALVYRSLLAADASAGATPAAEVRRPRVHHRPLVKGLCVLAGVMIAFFAGAPIALVALAAAGFVLLDRVRPEKIYREIDWTLLIMFVGLFVVVRGFEIHVVRQWGIDRISALGRTPVVLVSGLSLALSNLVSNVPAVLLFKPVIAVIPAKEQAWLALAMSSTLAGNLTLLGSVANLIVVESARTDGVKIGFAEYLKVGVPLTLLTSLTGIAWLALTRY